MKNLFRKYSEGDKIVKKILSDIEKSPQDYKKLSGGAFLYKGVEKWWGYIQMKPEVLTIRRKNAKVKDKNLHYKVNKLISEKYLKFYEIY